MIISEAFRTDKWWLSIALPDERVDAREADHLIVVISFSETTRVQVNQLARLTDESIRNVALHGFQHCPEHKWIKLELLPARGNLDGLVLNCVACITH